MELDWSEKEEIGEDNTVLEQDRNGALLEILPGTVSNHRSQLPVNDRRKIYSVLARKNQGLTALSCLLIRFPTIVIELNRRNELATATRKVEH